MDYQTQLIYSSMIIINVISYCSVHYRSCQVIYN
jgi:hypothetical protein